MTNIKIKIIKSKASVYEIIAFQVPTITTIIAGGMAVTQSFIMNFKEGIK